MLRRTTVAAAALLAAGALLLSACSGGSARRLPDRGTPDPDAVVNVRLEPSNLDIRETAGAALDQILIDNVYQGLVSRAPDQKIVDSWPASHEVSPTASPTRSRSATASPSTTGQPLTVRTSSGRCSRSRTPRPTATRTASHATSIAANGRTSC
jgi:peptide/nickel transport system substrate-binding protein